MSIKLDKIKDMDEKQLNEFLKNYKDGTLCVKCGDTYTKYNKVGISITKQNTNTNWRSNGQKTKKLCDLCPKCYSELLSFIGVNDCFNEEDYVDASDY